MGKARDRKNQASLKQQANETSPETLLAKMLDLVQLRADAEAEAAGDAAKLHALIEQKCNAWLLQTFPTVYQQGPGGKVIPR